MTNVFAIIDRREVAKSRKISDLKIGESGYSQGCAYNFDTGELNESYSCAEYNYAAKMRVEREKEGFIITLVD